MSYIHNIDPVAFSIMGLQIRWYGISYVLAILFSEYYIRYFSRKKYINVPSEFLESLSLYVVVGLMIGARLGYIILFDNLDYYLQNPIKILKINEGGLAFHGGIIGGLLGAYLSFHKYKKNVGLNFLNILDLILLSLPFGIFFGRIANFINGELFGKYTDLSIGVVFMENDSPRHPSQLYEAMTEGLALFVILNLSAWIKDDISRKPGYISFMFLTFYSIFRFFNEYFRDSEVIYLGLTMGQLLSVITFVLSFVFYFVLCKKTHTKSFEINT